MLRVLVSFLLALFVSTVPAATVPVTNTQNALSGVIQQKMSARGFASNDPRWGATLTSIGSGIAGAAASAAVVTAAGVTAPAWITAAVGVGLSAVLSAGIGLAIDKLYAWYTNSDGTVTSGLTPTQYAGGYAPYQMYCLNSICSPSPKQACEGRAYVYSTFLGRPIYYYWSYRSSDGHCLQYKHYMDSGADSLFDDSPGPILVTSACAGVSLSPSGGLCPASNYPVNGGVTNGTVSDAAAAIPATEKVKAVNPTLIADLANESWKQAAAQPGYAGLPFDASNPITDAEAASWQAAHPSSWPTVGDIVSPQPAPSGGTAASPFTLPNSAAPVASVDPSASTSTGTNPSTQPLENLGPDPGIGFPALETIPTVPQILDPIFALFPSLRSYVVPQHTGTCPTATLSLFGRTQSIEAHCGLLESVRGLLSAIMLFVWGFVALRVTLSA